MNEKILICVYVPLIGQKYNIFIPINRKIGTLKKYIEKTVNELSDSNLKLSENLFLRNKITNVVYDFDLYVKDTDIRNGTKLVLL
ncbi:MAG: hypothetical protein HFI86_00385 [Bacilli bacterium]|nr:hypothetical protein [Bacilli bacterium]